MENGTITVLEKSAVPIPALTGEESAVVQRANALVITDQASFEVATSFLTSGVLTAIKKVEEFFKPLKVAAKATHTAVCDREKEMLKPFQDAKEIISGKGKKFLDEAERLRVEEQRREQALADQKAIKDRAAEVQAAKDAGLSKKEVAAIKKEPIVAETVSVASKVQTTGTGVNLRESWTAEVKDVGAFLRYVAANPVLYDLIEIKQAKLDRKATDMKTLFNIPGCVARKDTGFVGRAK